jgi:hypothetical protein
MLGVGGAVMGLITVALIAVMYFSFIYFAVRTAPAAAATIAQGRFSFFDSWKVSKGRFWALFGSFFLLWLIALVAIIGLEIAAFVTIFSSSGYPLTDVFSSPDPEAVRDVVMHVFAMPRTWAIAGAFYVALLVFYFAIYIGMFGINARAAVAGLEEGKLTPHDWGKE